MSDPQQQQEEEAAEKGEAQQQPANAAEEAPHKKHHKKHHKHHDKAAAVPDPVPATEEAPTERKRKHEEIEPVAASEPAPAPVVVATTEKKEEEEETEADPPRKKHKKKKSAEAGAEKKKKKEKAPTEAAPAPASVPVIDVDADEASTAVPDDKPQQQKKKKKDTKKKKKKHHHHHHRAAKKEEEDDDGCFTGIEDDEDGPAESKKRERVFDNEEEELAYEAEKLTKDVIRNGGASRHPLTGLEDVVSGHTALQPRGSKVKALQQMDAYTATGTEKLMHMSKKQRERLELRDIKRVMKQARKLLESPYCLTGCDALVQQRFAELTAWTAYRKDVVYTAMGKDPDATLDEELKKYATLSDPHKAKNDFNEPRLEVLKVLTELLTHYREAKSKVLQRQVAIVACIDFLCAPPREVPANKMSNGKMVCAFTGQAIPVSSQPCTLKFAFTDETGHKVERSFNVSAAAKTMIQTLYDFWNWPRVLLNAIAAKFDGPAATAAPDAIDRMVEEANSAELWKRFDEGRHVALALISKHLQALGDYVAKREAALDALGNGEDDEGGVKTNDDKDGDMLPVPASDDKDEEK